MGEMKRNEIAEIPGGLNGSMQHSAQTHNH